MNGKEAIEPLLAQLKLDHDVLGNSLAAWIVAGGVAVATIVLLFFAKSLVIARAAVPDSKTDSDWRAGLRGLAEASKLWFFLLLGIYFASLMLAVPMKGQRAIQAVTATAFLLQFGLWGNVVVHVLSQRWTRGRLQTDPSGVMMTSVFTFVSRIVLWVIITLLVLENIGVEVTALITGLGIGGVAVALAAQNILGDIFASLSIIVDRPFVLGDFIIVGDMMGTVENIGMKTTRVRSLSGEQLIFPNAGLLQSRIRNCNRQHDRRVVFTLNLKFDTPAEKLEKIPEILREIVEPNQAARFDRAHFAAIGDYSMKFEVVYVVLTADFNKYMDIQQRINLEILRRLAAEEIQLANSKPDPVALPAPPSDGTK